VIPVPRDQLFPSLALGYGDIVMAGTTITESRRAQADFTNPVSKPLKEILITGPSAPSLVSLEDLSGKTVYVRLSSSYAGSVHALSKRFVAEGKLAIRIEAVDESLEDEDLIEMSMPACYPGRSLTVTNRKCGKRSSPVSPSAKT
jgi:ABC-type amino acid transport substrate-binding protein